MFIVDDGEIYEDRVEQIIIDKYGVSYCFYDNEWQYIDDWNFKNEVFASREEAERSLKERLR